ncbi:ABC-F family ATP-binding cassette domain-containing protein [Hymenobacter latericus]|uniref:ABC-F family ATP-binding cassette domain-containing protein n=1 Tax=Hymenobacter sp. YIM 151858-1 TaxID=2987688 RepID=UPI002227EBFB|nr:ABC-F family ATP-binding cassette domain-containing protein [Hymenobacter sp. YIM 151858-1]UYZ59608.1 ABC-F family ATP-binding cassette domain-containing protein [Hymenobacter sp. YIM 151858-1]
MNLLSAENISKNYADRWLFRDLSFGLQQGQRTALVGVNGSGKTTLLRVLAGLEPPDTGLVGVRNGVRLGFLPQQPTFDNNLTVQQSIFAGENATLAAVRDYERLMLKGDAADPTELQHALQRMDVLNAWDYEAQVRQILGQLGIHDLEQRVGSLSGGQQKRVALARLLIEEPEVIILDEPTNHLDLDTIEWLENRLASPTLTLLMVTHDRYFLDRVANEIVELDRGQVHRYQGNYAYFVEKKAERELMEAVEVEKARNLLRKELEWMRRQPQARGTKQKARIEAFYETQEKAKGRGPQQQVELSVKSTRQGNKVLEAKHLMKRFGEKTVLNDFSHVFRKQERLGIVGPNGAGKTTLLNILTQRLQPDSGEVEAGQTTVFGYYTQQELQYTDDQRVIDVVKEVAEVVEMADGSVLTASQLLQHFLFPPAQQYTLVDKLSGGEKRRLQLLRVLIKNPNFLILDEPTNDLDIVTLNILEDFLLNFAGCLVLVSHDRYFMDRLVEQLLVLEPGGRVRLFPGNYTDYRQFLKDQQAAEAAAAAAKAAKATASAAAVAAPAASKARRATFAEKKEYEQLEAAIAKLEDEKKQLVEQMNSGSGSHQQLAEWAARLQQLDADLDAKGERWLELAELVD